MSSLFSSKAIIGYYVSLTLFKAIIGYCDLSQSKAIIRCRIPSSKAIIGCYVFLTLFKAIIGYCDLSPSKAIIRCRVLFHPKPLLGVMPFSPYSKPLLDIVIFLHLKPLLDVESLHLKPLLDVESFFIQSHYWVLCRSHFIQSHYWIL